VTGVGSIPAGLFVAAGAAAAFNPCGMALLPAYAALLLGRGTTAPGPWPAALAAAAAATAGFLTVYAIAGLAGGAAVPLLVRVPPYLGVLLGLALLALGLVLLAGGTVGAAGPGRLAGRLAPAQGAGLRRAYAFGVAYALGSLACTFPLFAALMAGALASGSWAGGVRACVLYALGMGAVVTPVFVAATLGRDGLRRALARGLPWVERLAGGVVAAMGFYLLRYWLWRPGSALRRG
jgi:cytochrome c biogenesis protein CcdA